MHDSPLVQTFRALSQAERSGLRKWIQSPFFNQREDVIRLFEYLNAQLPVRVREVPPAVLDKRLVHSSIFQAGKRQAAAGYKDSDIRYAMSFLYQAIKAYLAYSHWAKEELDTGRHLCRALRQHGLEQVFEKEYSSLAAQLNKAPHQSVDYFFQQYHFHLERWELFRRSNRGASDILRQAGAARDSYFASETLRQACAVLAQPGQADERAGSVYLQATLEAVAAGSFAQVPAVMAYYHCYRILQAQDDTAETHFLLLQDQLEQHWQIFPDNEVRDLYVGAINYCIRRLNSGARSYIRAALDLYRSGLERRTILEDGLLNKYTYNNILLLALALDEWDWAFRFLEEYKTVLPHRDREGAWHYNLATYYFRKKDYAQAQGILRQVEFRDVFYHLDARRMLVRIYFDTGEWSALESLLDSFTVYLQRKRGVLGYHRDLNLNFVHFVKRLIRVEPGDQGGRVRLRPKIAATRYVAEREWLLEQCGQGPAL